jgi:hypothetical protein
MHTVIEELTGGCTNIKYGIGTWQARVEGKWVLNAVINKHFKVATNDGIQLDFKDSKNRIEKDLAQKKLCHQPNDFRLLHDMLGRLINGRVRAISV